MIKIHEIKVFDDNGNVREIKTSQYYIIKPLQKSLSKAKDNRNRKYSR